MNVHIRSAVSDLPIQCSMCVNKYLTFEGLKKHLIKNHQDEKDFETVLQDVNGKVAKEKNERKRESRKRKVQDKLGVGEVFAGKAMESYLKAKRRNIVSSSGSEGEFDSDKEEAQLKQMEEDDPYWSYSDSTSISGDDFVHLPDYNRTKRNKTKKKSRKSPKKSFTAAGRSSRTKKGRSKKGISPVSPIKKYALKKILSDGTSDSSSSSSSSSDTDSDPDKAGPSIRRHGRKKSKRNGKKESKSDLNEDERAYLASYDPMLRDWSHFSNHGIDVNVRIDDLDMANIKRALYKAYSLMQGRGGYISITAGALLLSISGDHLKLWYPSGNGINITIPGRSYHIGSRENVDKLLLFLSKNLDQIIEGAKQSFPASDFPFSLKSEIPKTVQKNARIDSNNLIKFSPQLGPVLCFFACLCAFLRAHCTNSPLNYLCQHVLKPAGQLMNYAKSKLKTDFLKKDGSFNIKLIPKLSELLKLDIGVWVTDKLGNDQHKISTYSQIALENSYPEVQILSLPGMFYLIKNLHLFMKRFPCEFCTRVFTSKEHLRRHKNPKSCTFLKFMEQHPNSPNPEFEYWMTDIVFERFFHCGRYRPRKSLINRIGSLLGVTTDGKYLSIQDYCLCYDIETSQAKAKYGNPDGDTSGFVSTHEILCISVCTDIPQLNDVEGICLINFDKSVNFLRECLDYMLYASELAFENNKRKYEWLLRLLDDTIKAANDSQKTGFAKQLTNLKEDIIKFMKKLPCFGFNSSSFDLVALRTAGFFHLLSKAENRHPRALKSGNSYNVVDSGDRLLFLDILNYVSGKCSLRKFLKDMQVPESQNKLYFWYDRFTPQNSQKELMKTSPPKYSDFFSHLKNVNLLDEEYQEFTRLSAMGCSEALALDLLELTEKPLTGPERYIVFLKEWISLQIKHRYEYLARYCSRDVTSLMLAVRSFKRTFLTIGINPFYYSSLSSMGFPILVAHLAKTCTTGADFFTAVNEEAFYLLKRSQIGGLCHAFNRLAVCNLSRIKPHQYGQSAEVVKQILQLDLNALYPSTIGKRCTTAAGFYAIRRKENNFNYETVMEKTHSAHSWVLFLEKLILHAKLKSALSFGGEKKLVFDNGTSAYLDAWLDQSDFTPQGKRICLGYGYNYHGCFWHACPNCYKQEIADNVPHPRIKGMTYRQVWERTKRMDAMIRSHPQIKEYRVKWEHEWLEDIRTNPFIAYFVANSCHYGPPIVQQTMSETEAVGFIKDRQIVGFVECSLAVPDRLLSQFLEFPPIFVKETVTMDHLKGRQKMIAENRKSLGSGQTTVMAKFAGDNIVIGTDLFIWYLEAGLELKSLTTILQFRENLAFESWLDEIVEGRRQADSLKSTVLANMWKLIGNGSYGFASLNLSKRKDVRFGELKTLKYWMTRPAYFQSYEANEIDRNSDYFEILLNKYRVQERLPLQFSCDVLSTSKRILFETVYDFCGKYFDPKKWTLLGLDTDGFAFACASQNLVDIVKPELKDEFENVKYKWLVPDEKSDLQERLKREPLFLKTEMKADLAAVYLAAKSYIIVDKTSVTKTAHKGFSAKLNPELVRLRSFIHALFADGNPETSQHAKLSGFRQNSLGQMGTYMGTRTSMSNLAIKFDYCC